MLCASGTCSAPTGAGAEKRWQNNNLCELGNRSGTGRKESAFNRRGPTRKPDNQLGFEMFADDCNCTGHLGVDAFCLALHGADLHIRSGAVTIISKHFKIFIPVLPSNAPDTVCTGHTLLSHHLPSTPVCLWSVQSPHKSGNHQLRD